MLLKILNVHRVGGSLKKSINVLEMGHMHNSVVIVHFNQTKRTAYAPTQWKIVFNWILKKSVRSNQW